MAVRSRRSHSDEFKANAVRLAEKKLSAKEQAEADKQELFALHQENAELKDVVHILKRAAAVISKDQLK